MCIVMALTGPRAVRIFNELSTFCDVLHIIWCIWNTRVYSVNDVPMNVNHNTSNLGKLPNA